MHTQHAKQLVEIADEIHLARGVAYDPFPVGKVFPHPVDGVSGVEDGFVLGYELVEIDRLALAVPLVLPVILRQPGVGFAKDRGFGLKEQPRPAGTAERDATGLELVDQRRGRRANRAEQDGHVFVAVALLVQLLDRGRDDLGFSLDRLS